MNPRSEKKNKKEKKESRVKKKLKQTKEFVKENLKEIVENNKKKKSKEYPQAINAYDLQQNTTPELDEEKFELLNPHNVTQVPPHYLPYSTQPLQSSEPMMTSHTILSPESELQQQMEKAIDAGNVALFKQLIETAKERGIEENINYLNLLTKSLWVKNKAFLLTKTIIENFEDDENSENVLIVRLVNETNVFERLIYLAALEGDLEFLENCARYTTNHLNININFVLICAAINGHDHVVEHLLHKGISPDDEINESYVSQMFSWLRGENPDDASNQPSSGKSLFGWAYDQISNWTGGTNQDNIANESPKSKSIYEYVQERRNNKNESCVTLLSYGTKKYLKTFLKTMKMNAIRDGKCNASKINETIVGAQEAGAWKVLNHAYLLQLALREKSHAFPLAKAIIDHTKINDDAESYCIERLEKEDFVRLAYAAGSEGNLAFMQDCLKHLNQDHYSATINFTCLQAAMNGQEEVVQYLLSLQPTLPDIEIKENGLSAFQAWIREGKMEDISNGSLNEKSLLKWVTENRNSKNEGCIKLLTSYSQKSVSEFFDAISRGDGGKVNQSLVDGVSTKVQSSDYMTPLGMAVKNGKADIVKILLEKGEDPDEETWVFNNNKQDYEKTTPFWIAYHNNDSACLKLIIPKSKAAEATMIDGIKTGHQKLVEFLLPHGFAELVDEKELLKIALEFHSEAKTNDDLKIKIAEVIKYLLPHSKTTKEQMFSEVEEGKSDTIEQFLGFGFDISATNGSGQTLLQVAAQQGHANVVKVMLEAGADSDTALTLARDAKHTDCVKLLTAVSEQAKNELFAAASRGETAIIKKLLDEGADRYAVMSKALEHKNLACIQALLQFEFDVDLPLQNSQNLSALNIAMRDNYDDCLKFIMPKSKVCISELYKAVKENRQEDARKLLEYGVNPDTKLEDQEWSALELARKMKNKELILLLTPHSQQAIFEVLGADKDGQLEIAKQRLEEGVSFSAALVEALNTKNSKGVSTLLKCKEAFNPDDILHQGKSALQIARETKDEECIWLLTVKSQVAINELQELIKSSNESRDLVASQLNKIKRLLKQGVKLTKSEDLELITAKKHYLWVNKKNADHPLIVDLNDEIEELHKIEGNEEARKAFVDSLEIMRDDLRSQINKQRPNLDEQCRAAKIAKYTTDMLADLRKPKDATMDAGAYQDARLEILKNYENNCKKTYRRSTGLKILAMVVFGAVGFVAGVAIGMGIGIALGAWSGPGAFVTAALGGVAGGVSGAVIGVLAGAGGTAAVGSMVLSGVTMFKPRGLRKEVEETVSLSKSYVCSGS